MCEFCLKHGEGRRWYLEASNYAEDLLSDLGRKKFIQRFFEEVQDGEEDIQDALDALGRAPAVVQRFFRWKTVRRMKKNHFGQIVPIEDIEKIFGFVNSIVRVACICRHLLLKEEKRYCYGVSMGPNGGRLAEIFRDLDQGYLSGPDAQGAEVVSREEALDQFRSYEKEGLCHSVWTFKTPFIGGVCNCDRPDCLAMQMSLVHGVPVMFRAEYVAEIDPASCKGCRSCMRVCQFGAIGFSAARHCSQIDPRRCYGCGICRSVCKGSAIGLKERSRVPQAARLWQ